MTLNEIQLPQDSYEIKLRCNVDNTSVPGQLYVDERTQTVKRRSVTKRRGQVFVWYGHPGCIPKWASVVSDTRSDALRKAHERQWEKYVKDDKAWHAKSPRQGPRPSIPDPSTVKAKGGGKRGRPTGGDDEQVDPDDEEQLEVSGADGGGGGDSAST